MAIVAPARERGLKSAAGVNSNAQLGRSREGAWIEIVRNSFLKNNSRVAPARERGLKSPVREAQAVWSRVAPARERGLKCLAVRHNADNNKVAPARERGLK